ncbi:EAL domain-containing protein [Sporosarcina sp. ACRSL]|uniref:putative bifunctional diguanylate cyclase/phosphodiesterase n=1 Tax=Sporosarcina sp. ACRSL TaxID=2918215 RepID=UPI001EF5C78D|nr:EAL domain-containing protein [Sporosarcina sp. ACRSL]MCG7343255.1 EAL domain-containing protein [Sporosarcina sp. ACRSL]
MMRKMTGEDNQQNVEDMLVDIAYALDQSAIVAITDRTGKITYVNELFTKMSQYKAEELIGASHAIINSGYHSKEFFKHMWATIGRGNIWHGEIRNRAKDGSFYWVDTKIVPFLNDKGIPNRYISIRYDITERKLMEEKIRKDAEVYRKIVEENRDLSYNDQLTTLLNRHAFSKTLRASLEGKKRSSVGLVYLNIDRLRNVNDSFGQDSGDYVLSIVAKRLKKALSADDIIGRISGDEFAFTLTQAKNEEEAERMTEDIKASLEQPISIKGEIYTISTSCGIALFPKHAKTVSELMMKSEKALHYVQEHGRGTYKMYEPGTATKTLERILLENELGKSVQLGNFTLEYQPKMNLSRKTLSGVEALVRWNHPDLGRIPPDKFIPLAEETKIILPLGEWILREACKQANEWKRQGHAPFRIAVNMSAVQLEAPDIVQTIKRILDEEDLGPEYIEIELTESSFADRDEMQSTIQQIRNLGIQVAIDDFGTGYSTFSYIKELPADALKIDRSFVKDIDVNENSRAIVKAIVTLADTAGLNVIAEGIETEEQAKILRSLGCREGQGYFFSKPMPPEDCEFMFSKSVEYE